jgi:hypothetical protein
VHIFQDTCAHVTRVRIGVSKPSLQIREVLALPSGPRALLWDMQTSLQAGSVHEEQATTMGVERACPRCRTAENG